MSDPCPVSCNIELYGFNNSTKVVYMGFASQSTSIYKVFSVIGIVINVVLVLFFHINEKRNKEKIIFDRLLKFLSIIELCISAMWVAHSFKFSNKTAKEMVYGGACKFCRIFGAVWISLYIFEWLFLRYLLRQFNSLANVNGMVVFKYKKNLIPQIIVNLFFAFFSGLLAYVGKLSGISVRLFNNFSPWQHALQTLISRVKIPSSR